MGTLHAAPADVGVRAPTLILLNPGPAPRAGNSDLYTHIADRLSSVGISCLRIDLPGLGDSDGPSFPSTEEYWLRVQAGCNDAPVAAILAWARERFKKRPVVLGGLCAGAISATRCAANAGIAGLVLLEPNFRIASETGANARGADAGSPRPPPRCSRWSRARDLNSWLYLLTGDRRVAAPFAPLRPVLRQWLVRRIGHSLPPDVNAQLVVGWEHALEAGIPTLVVSAEGYIADRYIARIVEAFPASARNLVQRARVAGSNHIFTMGAGACHVADAVEQWMKQRFCMAEQSIAVPKAADHGRSVSRSMMG